MKRLIGKYKEALAVSGGVIILYIILNLLGITCPIKWMTGISCMGCGMTRAWLSVLKFDFSSALYYHPLFWTVPIAAVIYVFRDKIKIYKWLLLLIAVLFCVVYFIRMFDPSDTVVVFEPWFI